MYDNNPDDYHRVKAVNELLGTDEALRVREDGSHYIELFEGSDSMQRARRVRDSATLLLEAETPLDVVWNNASEQGTGTLVYSCLRREYDPDLTDYIQAFVSHPRELLSGDMDLGQYELTADKLPNGYRFNLEERY